MLYIFATAFPIKITDFGRKCKINKITLSLVSVICRVESGIFGQTSKFGQPPSLFYSSVIGIKIKLNK